MPRRRLFRTGMAERTGGILYMITVNAMGDACPIRVIKTKTALQELSGAG